NYRKQISPSVDELLPETDFRLLALCVRSPRKLDEQAALTLLRAGVYELRVLTLCIRIIVVHELPQEDQNAMLLLFSANEALLQYGEEHFRPGWPETSTLLYQLFLAYSEDPDMPNELQEFVRKSIDELLQKLPPEERLKGLSAEERLKGLSAEERL